MHSRVPSIVGAARNPIVQVVQRNRSLPLHLQYHRYLSAAACPATVFHLDTFRDQHFRTGRPAHFPALFAPAETALPALSKWFTVNSHGHAALDHIYFSDFAEHLVPLELTTRTVAPNGHVQSEEFHRLERPLSEFLSFITLQSSPDASRSLATPSLYLAQHSLESLPRRLKDDLPPPQLVLRAGRGDIYASSIWLGLAPTSTPMHRDPNPNLLVQLAGRKRIRMISPELGRDVFQSLQASSGSGAATSGQLRGEEMMAGVEKTRSEAWLWGDQEGEGGEWNGGFEGVQEREKLKQDWFEADLEQGGAVFIPQGWWHGVRGVGKGLSASVNWWFR